MGTHISILAIDRSPFGVPLSLPAPMLYRHLLRPALFRLLPDAEDAHDFGLGALAALSEACRRCPPLLRLARRLTAASDDPPAWGRSETLSLPRLSRTLAGIRFPGPVGVAGGFDKRARAIHGWAALGFGFVEVGTVTRHAQPGNDRPRAFRIPARQALINRFGFNNPGSDALAETLRRLGPFPIPVMVSIGKSKITPNEEAAADYLHSLRAVHPVADLISVNVSSPNTPGLRSLQDADALRGLLSAIMDEARRLGPPPQTRWHSTDPAHPAPTTIPVFLKISPDMSDTALDELLTVVIDCGITGLIATNTTLDRSALPADTPHRDEAGGLSGAPLIIRSLEVIRHIRACCPALPLIGVGGINSPETAKDMLEAGADLIQIYTGLVYEGPGLIRAINRKLRSDLGNYQ
jgi:dihydroorotate dehydrogenase